MCQTRDVGRYHCDSRNVNRATRAPGHVYRRQHAVVMATEAGKENKREFQLLCYGRIDHRQLDLSWQTSNAISKVSIAVNFSKSIIFLG